MSVPSIDMKEFRSAPRFKYEVAFMMNLKGGTKELSKILHKEFLFEKLVKQTGYKKSQQKLSPKEMEILNEYHGGLDM